MQPKRACMSALAKAQDRDEEVSARLGSRANCLQLLSAPHTWVLALGGRGQQCHILLLSPAVSRSLTLAQVFGPTRGVGPCRACASAPCRH